MYNIFGNTTCITRGLKYFPHKFEKKHSTDFHCTFHLTFAKNYSALFLKDLDLHLITRKLKAAKDMQCFVACGKCVAFCSFQSKIIGEG